MTMNTDQTPMCTETDARRLVEEARDLESDDPQQARKKYLEAAEIMLLLSEQNKEHEEQCTKLAEQLYQRAQSIRTVSTNIPTVKDKTKTTFNDIGGLTKLKDEIRFKIIEPFKKPDIYEYFGKKVGGGILMYGPPGCGKALIAEATSNEAGATFFHVKASDLKSKYVGETEKNIADLFKKARSQQPSIIFFDEFEALGGDRSNSPAHEKNAVAQLLTEMDGLGAKNQRILLLAATNEPWSIDPALLREGRFGTTIYIPPPDETARQEILKLNLKNKPVESISIQDLVQKTELFSGADLTSLCEKAADIPLREYFKTGKLRKITRTDFDQARTEIKSIVKPWMRKAQITVAKLRLEEHFSDLMDQASTVLSV